MHQRSEDAEVPAGKATQPIRRKVHLDARLILRPIEAGRVVPAHPERIDLERLVNRAVDLRHDARRRRALYGDVRTAEDARRNEHGAVACYDAAAQPEAAEESERS